MLQLSRTSRWGATTLTCVMQGGDCMALCPLRIIFKHVIHIRNLSTDGDVVHMVVRVTAKVVDWHKPQSFGPNPDILGLWLWLKQVANLAEQCPVVGLQMWGQLHGLQPSSLKPQKPGRHWLQSAPPTPDLQRHCPLLGWHQVLPIPGCGGKEPRGSHQQPVEHTVT